MARSNRARDSSYNRLEIPDLVGSVANQLRAARLWRNMTQTELGIRAGMSQPHIARLENGSNVTILTLLRVCEAMGAGLNIFIE